MCVVSSVAFLLNWQCFSFVTCTIASVRFLSHKPQLGHGVMSNRSLMLGKMGLPVSWSSSSSSSRSILKRRDGGVFSLLLLLISMSLNGEPGSAMLDIGKSGNSLFLLEAASARVRSAVNILVGLLGMYKTSGVDCKRCGMN